MPCVALRCIVVLLCRWMTRAGRRELRFFILADPIASSTAAKTQLPLAPSLFL